MLCFLSAGVGRTGVFITLSIVLERMRYEGVVDLFQTVKTLRTQRPAMVQTEVRPPSAVLVDPVEAQRGASASVALTKEGQGRSTCGIVSVTQWGPKTPVVF